MPLGSWSFLPPPGSVLYVSLLYVTPDRRANEEEAVCAHRGLGCGAEDEWDPAIYDNTDGVFTRGGINRPTKTNATRLRLHVESETTTKPGQTKQKRPHRNRDQSDG